MQSVDGDVQKEENFVPLTRDAQKGEKTDSPITHPIANARGNPHAIRDSGSLSVQFTSASVAAWSDFYRNAQLSTEEAEMKSI